MAIEKSPKARNAACNAIVDLLDDGTSSSAGWLAIYDATAFEVIRLPLSNPAFGDSVDGTATANMIYDATSVTGGDASSFAFLDRDSASVWGGRVTYLGQGGDMELDSTVIPVDTTVSISSAVYIVPK